MAGEFQGVDQENPTLVRYVKSMVAQGRTLDEDKEAHLKRIRKVTGAHPETIARIMREAEKK